MQTNRQGPRTRAVRVPCIGALPHRGSSYQSRTGVNARSKSLPMSTQAKDGSGLGRGHVRYSDTRRPKAGAMCPMRHLGTTGGGCMSAGFHMETFREEAGRLEE